LCDFTGHAGMIKLWNANNFKLMALVYTQNKIYPEHALADYIIDADFVSHLNGIVVVHSDQTIRLWDSPDLAYVKVIAAKFYIPPTHQFKFFDRDIHNIKYYPDKK
jgi:hypothetical protein